MKKIRTLNVGYWKKEQTELTEVIFADDMAKVVDSEKNLQYNLEVLHKELAKINMKRNMDKIKSMIISRENNVHRRQLQEK